MHRSSLHMYETWRTGPSGDSLITNLAEIQTCSSVGIIGLEVGNMRKKSPHVGDMYHHKNNFIAFLTGFNLHVGCKLKPVTNMASSVLKRWQCVNCCNSHVGATPINGEMLITTKNHFIASSFHKKGISPPLRAIFQRYFPNRKVRVYSRTIRVALNLTAPIYKGQRTKRHSCKIRSNFI